VDDQEYVPLLGEECTKRPWFFISSSIIMEPLSKKQKPIETIIFKISGAFFFFSSK